MTSGTDPFTGEGEVRALARSVDWAATPLGPVRSWSGTLRAIVRACLDSPFPINLWCGPEVVLIYNDAYRQVLGSKHPWALGRSGPDVWAEIWDEIAPVFDRIRAGGPALYREDAPFIVQRAEEAATPENGPNAWFTFSLSPVRDEAGEIVAFLNIVSETTPRIVAERAREAARETAERAEARLRDVFAHAPAFMAVLRGPEHVFEYVNEAYYQLVGHRELLGRPVFEAIPEARGQGFEKLLDDVLATGEPFVGREVPVLVSRTPASDPEERFVDLIYYPITEADGTRSGVVAHGSDVTEHVLARREAQQARAEAERANTAKSQFLATMSHEVRTPINAVIGYADLLDAGISGSLTAGQVRYVEGIQASSRHLLGLVSEILDLAKIEAGEMAVAAEEIAARPPVAAALRLIAPQAEQKGIALAEEWEHTDEVRVLADEDRLRQILLNLLSNALKFTDPGGTITLRCRTPETAPVEAALPEVGPWVVIEVEDTGRGIPSDQVGRVFEPFVQAESGHTRRAGGTGLGLTISRRLARLMGGDLTLRSEAGAGSCFSLWLPPGFQERVAPRDDEEVGTEPWPPPPDQRAGLGSAGRTLLSTLDHVEQQWVERLRTDLLPRHAARLNKAQLADQTAELIAATAKVLFVLEEGGGDPALLRDAEDIQELVAKRHGQQRRRLGWSRGELEREYRLLSEIIDDVVRREGPKRTAADLGTALGVLHRLIGRAEAVSVAVFDSAAGLPDAQG